MDTINEYISNPNQRKITINKENCDTSNIYARINLDALKNAMHTLTPKAFELWIYFARNQDKHAFYLSKVDFLNWSNIKSTSYYKAFDELVNENYLVPIDKENPEPKFYNFYEMPQEEQEPIGIVVHKYQEPQEFKEFIF